MLSEFISSDLFEIILKLTLSCVLAGIIGIERSSLSKPAGFGTHSIIGLSSALVVMASQYMSYYYNIDASRIPSQILAGIGFIGAGTIIRNGINVRGVTTAAGILSVTCIGIAVGMGYYTAAVVSTLIVFIVLSINHDMNSKFERYEGLDLVITLNNTSKTIEEIEDFFKKEKITIQNIKKDTNVIKDKKLEVLNVSVTYDTKSTSKNEIISKLISMKSVYEVRNEE